MKGVDDAYINEGSIQLYLLEEVDEITAPLSTQSPLRILVHCIRPMTDTFEPKVETE